MKWSKEAEVAKCNVWALWCMAKTFSAVYGKILWVAFLGSTEHHALQVYGSQGSNEYIHFGTEESHSDEMPWHSYRVGDLSPHRAHATTELLEQFYWEHLAHPPFRSCT
jgi:hypothetical protein